MQIEKHVWHIFTNNYTIPWAAWQEQRNQYYLGQNKDQMNIRFKSEDLSQLPQTKTKS